jgi:hypothetical protein
MAVLGMSRVPDGIAGSDRATSFLASARKRVVLRGL